MVWSMKKYLLDEQIGAARRGKRGKIKDFATGDKRAYPRSVVSGYKTQFYNWLNIL